MALLDFAVNPGRVVMVGDQEVDVLAAHNAGIPVALIRAEETAGSGGLTAHRPIWCFGSLDALATWVTSGPGIGSAETTVPVGPSLAV